MQKEAGYHTLAVTRPCTHRRVRLRAQCGDRAWEIVSVECTRWLPPISEARAGRPSRAAAGRVGCGNPRVRKRVNNLG